MIEQEIEALQEGGIFALECIPSNDAPVIVLAHGINADHTEDRSANKPGLFDLLVEGLVSEGFGTIRFDFRGHGKSGAVPGYVSISSEVEDLNHVLRVAGEANRQVMCIVGCSFGACATSNALANSADTAVVSAVLINPVLKPYETFIDPGTEWARASFTPEALRKLEADGVLMLDGSFPLGPSFMRDLQSVDPTGDLDKFAGSMAIVHGSADTYVPFEVSRDYAAKRRCSFLSVDGSEHGFGNIHDRRFVAEFVTDYISWSIRRAS